MQKYIQLNEDDMVWLKDILEDKFFELEEKIQLEKSKQFKT